MLVQLIRLGSIFPSNDAKVISRWLRLGETRKDLGVGQINNRPQVGETLKLFKKDQKTNEHETIETSPIRKIDLKGTSPDKNEIYLIKTTNSKYLLQFLE